MSYSGENRYFSFRDGFCESLPNVQVGSAESAELGRSLSRFFRRFAVGCEGFRHMHILYAICCGISECGKDVCVCENTDLPSFRFSIPLLSADCGIFIGGEGCIKISFFDRNGFHLPSHILKETISHTPVEKAEKCGRIKSSTTFRNIYIDNLADSCGNTGSSIPAGISCGSRSVRSLWLEFFTGCDDSLVFQISDDGQKVNAYSSQTGFISHEKLMLAYATGLSEKGETVYLPENFHYMADCEENGNKINMKRFSTERRIPQEAVNQRFLLDPLYMCIHLADNKKNFMSRVKNLPHLACTKREIIVKSPENMPCGKTLDESNGRIIISRSGRNRITLLAQSYSSETASELCCQWCDRLKRMDTERNR